MSRSRSRCEGGNLVSFAEDNARAWSEITDLHRTRPQDFGTVETANGPGATLAQTEALRELLPVIFARYGVKTVLDVGCGDWNWMSHVDLDGIDYTGWDVEESMIAADSEQFVGRNNARFAVQSLLTAESIPKVDLILARHVLIHFPNDEIVKVLDKMRASGAKYLLTSHWPGGSNEDYEPEGFAWRGYMERALNMEAPPFNLPARVEAIHEPAADAGVLMTEHELALYELQETAIVGTVRGGLMSVVHCEHTSTYRVHRADDTVATVCNSCQQVLDVKNETGGVFSFHDTVARWQADIAERAVPGSTDRPARLQGRPISNKELLRRLREELRPLVERAHIVDMTPQIIRALAAVTDAILEELIGDDQ
jgi:SAM-dependent methyltransferase